MQYYFSKNLFSLAIILGFFLFESKFALFSVPESLDILLMENNNKQTLRYQKDDAEVALSEVSVLNEVMNDNRRDKSRKY